MSGDANVMWEWVARRLASEPEARLAYPKHLLPHPREAGARVSVGLPAGQLADFRFPPDGACRGVHVHEYADRWVAHLDQVHPACSVPDHLRQDAPALWRAGGAVLGAAVGVALDRSPGALLLGAGLGLLLALATEEAGGRDEAQGRVE